MMSTEPEQVFKSSLFVLRSLNAPASSKIIVLVASDPILIFSNSNKGT